VVQHHYQPGRLQGCRPQPPVLGQGDTLTNKVGVGSEVSLEGSNGLEGSLGGVIDGAWYRPLMGLDAYNKKNVDDAAKAALKAVAALETQPAEDGSVVLLGLAEEGGLLVLGGDYEQDMLAKLR
jgi:hypothetical protein